MDSIVASEIAAIRITMTQTMVRVRFAPSPTGHLHIGGLRTAIFNWLFARHYNGVFLLRIEDTDKERSKKEYFDSILDSFVWMSMESDEPIVIQSERFTEHQRLIQQLIDEDKAYRCFCTRTIPVHDETEEGEAAYIKYDGTCRNYKSTKEDLQRPFVVRFKLPKFSSDVFSFNDIIYGEMSFPVDQFDDFIIARSDGNPMYNFVVVADDIFMRITHIIRGQEHLVNTPKQILLYQALGATVPVFAHLPLILGPSGAKLSKREAAVSVLSYKQEGYLAGALFNFLVRLGWSHGDQEIFTRKELMELFDLKTIHRHSAVFDIKKLEWLNGVYIRETSAIDLIALIERDIYPHWRSMLKNWTEQQIHQLIGLYKERIKTLRELADELLALHEVPASFDAVAEQFKAQTSIEHLQAVEGSLLALQDWRTDLLSAEIKKLCELRSIKLPMIAQPLRLALTGKTSSPGVFELMAILGKQESLKRLRAFIVWLQL